MRFANSLLKSFLAVSGLAALGACGEKAPPPPPPPPEVGVVTVAMSAVPVFSELPGRTSPYLVAQVRARVDGIVLRREFTEGADVKAGQRLYKIDPAPYVAALDSAKAALARAQANQVAQNAQVERYKVLVSGNAVSKQNYDNAVASLAQAAADVASARAAITTAQINLGYTDVTAPIAGRTGLSQVTPGALVSASGGTLLTTVQQLDPMYVDFTQSSVEGLRLRTDMQEGRLQAQGADASRIALTLEDGRAYRDSGRLQFADVSVDQGTGSVTVRAVFPNKGGVLLPGMFVRGRLEQGVNNKAILVPQVGVTHDQSGRAVGLVVGADSKVSQVVLTTAGTRGADWIVTGGLEPGSKVIVQGTERVRPGAQVRTVAATLPAASAPAAPASAASGT